MDGYYERHEVSNSDLSWLKRELCPPEEYAEPVNAYRFGRIIDYTLTEHDQMDYIHHTAGGEAVSDAEWELAQKMQRAFLADDTARTLYQLCKGQAVKTRRLALERFGVRFHINARCKYDFWGDGIGYGGDLKSTTATTQKQFEQAAEYFDYDRQRAWYMDITGADRDLLIGVSKVNLKVFKIAVTRDSDFYRRGREKYMRLAFKWWCLFGENKEFKTY